MNDHADLLDLLDDRETRYLFAAMQAARRVNQVAALRLISPPPPITCQADLDRLMTAFTRIIHGPLTH